MLKLLANCQIQKIKKFFSTRRIAKLITLACFFALFILLGFAIYFFFVEGFSYINSYPFFAQAIVLYSYEVYLLFIFLLIVISSFISGIFSLFKREENDWLLASPSYKVFPGLIFTSMLFSSLWPLLIIVLPSLLAAHAVFGLSSLFILISLLAVVFLTIFTVSMVLLTILTVGRVLQGLSSLLKTDVLNFKNLVAGILMLIFLGCGFIWYQSFSIDIVSLFKAQNLEVSTPGVSQISNNFLYSPAHPVAKTIYEFQNNNEMGGYNYAFLSLLLATAALSLLWLATEWFLLVWQKLQEGSFLARTTRKRKRKREKNIRLGGGPITTLIKKEILVSSRNTRDLLWFGFLIFIWLLQTGVNLILSESVTKYGIDTNLFPVIAHILQFITGTFFISAFVLRFVFPSFSMEKGTAWILGGAPIDRGKIFWSKLFFYLPLFLVIGLIIGYVNLLTLNFSLGGSIITFLLFFTVITFTVVFGLALGAIFPSFETDDPSVLSTSLPGLAFIVGSLAYGALGAWLLFTDLTAGPSWFLYFFLIATYVLVGWLIYLTPSRLRQMELVKDRL